MIILVNLARIPLICLCRHKRTGEEDGGGRDEDAQAQHRKNAAGQGREEVVRKTLRVGELSGKMRETHLRRFANVARRNDDEVGQRIWPMVVGVRGRGG